MTICGHTGCHRKALRIVSHEKPDHQEFKGQTHDCCAVHSRDTTPAKTEEQEDD